MQRRSSSKRGGVKRRRTHSAAAAGAGRVVRSGSGPYKLGRRFLPTTYTGGDELIRKYRRMTTDMTIWASGGFIVGTTNSTGLPTTWASFGATGTEVPSAANIGECGVSMQFLFTDIIQSASFVSLYNEYQIRKIELAFHMDCADSYGSGAGAVSNTTPSIYIAYDSNDATVPPSSDSVLARGDVQYHSLKHPFVFSFYPKPAVSMFQGLVASGYAAPKSTKDFWIDLTSPSTLVPHYGVKAWIRNFSTAGGQGMNIRVQPTVYFACRRTR